MANSSVRGLSSFTAHLADGGGKRRYRAAPNVTQQSDYYLMMLDSTGDSAVSPIFSLSRMYLLAVRSITLPDD